MLGNAKLAVNHIINAPSNSSCDQETSPSGNSSMVLFGKVYSQAIDIWPLAFYSLNILLC